MTAARKRGGRPAALLALAWLLATPAVRAADVPGAAAGRVRFVQTASRGFDVYTRAPGRDRQEWMRAHYARMLVYTPYFDTRLAWYPDGWVYKDLYAIYPGSPTATAHPEWILREASGSPLYIRFACAKGRCSQYAADVGNPAFRAHWIAEASAVLAKGYRGLLVDDVNMLMSRVSNGNGEPVAPRDPRTGNAMAEADWRRYVAELTEEIRAASPRKEIVHNALWFAPRSDPFVQRQLLAADVIALERGVNDAGIVRGSGTYGFETLLGLIDWLHEHGRAVWLDGEATDDAGREYGLAAYLLVSSGADYLGQKPGGEPDAWWPGYDVDLGAPAGKRYVAGGVFRRDFERGAVLVNQPGAPQATVELGGSYADLAGATRTSVTLGPARGAVLRRAGSPSAQQPPRDVHPSGARR
jgi:hypothetical protein